MENLKKKGLPIDGFRRKIVQTVVQNQVTIVNADTGGGKTTQVPQFLLEDTDYHLVVTQPRRLATKTVAARVAHETGTELGELIGFRTALERSRITETTRCLFATDGLQLVRELTASKKTLSKGIVLIIDEIHEWNINIETLIAWVRTHILEGSSVKVVLMSATAEMQKLSEFFDDAPIINVPGRCYPVAGSPSTGIYQLGSGEIVNQIKGFVASGINTLVFLPGKGEIADIQSELEKLKLEAVVLPLHAELETDEQDRVFKEYSLPKVILSTNIAQTSITIPDIEAVVDSGLEKRKKLVNNVETIVLTNISQADCKQRAGRAGRVQPGEYVLCNDTPYADLEQYSTPEIMNSLLDQVVLRLAGANLDAVDLPFFHQPSKSVLIEAKKTLVTIKALDKNGKITKLGREINQLPVNVKVARMIIESLRRKCLGPVIRIAAILSSSGGSLKRRPKRDDPAHYDSWKSLVNPNKEYKSDLLLELDLYFKAKGINPKLLKEKGISPKSYFQTKQTIEQLFGVIKSMGYDVDECNENSKNETEVLKSIISGMIGDVYVSRGWKYSKDNVNQRSLSRDSVFSAQPSPDVIVGEPFNISFKNKSETQVTLELLKNNTKVEIDWIQELAPELFSVSHVHGFKITNFNGVVLEREYVGTGVYA